MTTHTPFDGIDPPSEAEIRAMMEAEGLTPERWNAPTSHRFAVHEHDYHKVLYCVDGGLWFTFPDDPDLVIEMEPGDRLDLPAGVRHGAQVGMDGVLCLEARRA